MKKILSVLLATMIVVSMGVASFAALPSDNPVGGSNREVTQTIKITGGNEKITVYHNTAASRELLGLVNAERTAAGLPAYSWNSSLEAAALTRAMEQYFAPSHTRPDGTKFTSVSSLVNGENLAGGDTPDYYQASGVMADWITSPGHRANILDTDFKTMTACSISTDTGTYWVQLFSVDSGGVTTNTETTAKTTTAVTTAKTTGTPVAKTNTTTVATGASAASIRLLSAQGTVLAQNISALTSANLKSYATHKTLYADTLSSNGAILGRLYIQPASLATRETDYKLGVYTGTGNANLTQVKNYFTKYFKNNLTVLQIEESNLGVSTHVTARVNLDGMSTDNLAFYTFDLATHKYFPIADSTYSIDKNGFLHFYTAKGGYIVISDGALIK